MGIRQKRSLMLLLSCQHIGALSCYSYSIVSFRRNLLQPRRRNFSCSAIADFHGSPKERSAPGSDDLPYGSEYHVPVLCLEVIQALVTVRDGIYVDCTLGGGGHSKALLDALGNNGKVIGLDKDPEALMVASKRLKSYIHSGQFKAIRTNFANAVTALDEAQYKGQIDGMLLDLGVSSHQLDDALRGFSYSYDGPLDMRMDGSEGYNTHSAADLCNDLDEKDLGNIIYQLGEEKRSRKIARAIVNARPLQTTGQLTAAICSAVPRLEERKTLSRVFQALRIKVNSELTSLEAGLDQAKALIKPGGRIVVLSYHSLEDRRVKRILSSGNLKNRMEKDFFGNNITPWLPLYRKPITPSLAEISANPRSRSVKMRAAIRTDYP